METLSVFTAFLQNPLLFSHPFHRNCVQPNATPFHRGCAHPMQSLFTEGVACNADITTFERGLCIAFMQPSYREGCVQAIWYPFQCTWKYDFSLEIWLFHLIPKRKYFLGKEPSSYSNVEVVNMIFSAGLDIILTS